MAKSNRVSKTVIAGVSEEQFNDAVYVYAYADTKIEKINAEMNLAITKIREKHAAELEAQAGTMAASMEVIQAYCMENKAVLFAHQRHIDTAHGKIGFRLGTPKLKTLPKWTWDRVLEKMESVLPEFVRVKKEVAKDELLIHRTDATVAPHLASIGVYVDQDESFYVELKKEE